jgi:hypothetical protein
MDMDFFFLFKCPFIVEGTDLLVFLWWMETEKNRYVIELPIA